MSATGLPPIPPGTRLYLRSGDWYHPTGADGDYFRDIVVVVKVHSESATATGTSVWVTGHGLECIWPSVDDHPPCVELRVKVAALRRAIGAGPQP